MSNKKQLEAKLTDRQKHAALLLVQNELNEYYNEETGEKEKLRKEDIADMVGVKRITIYRWENENQDFIDYKNILADTFLKAKRTFVYRQLLRAIDGQQPSVNAIKLYLQTEGLLVDKQVVEHIERTADKSNEELAQEMAEIDDLLADDDDK